MGVRDVAGVVEMDETFESVSYKGNYSKSVRDSVQLI